MYTRKLQQYAKKKILAKSNDIQLSIYGKPPRERSQRHIRNNLCKHLYRQQDLALRHCVVTRLFNAMPMLLAWSRHSQLAGSQCERQINHFCSASFQRSYHLSHATQLIMKFQLLLFWRIFFTAWRWIWNCITCGSAGSRYRRGQKGLIDFFLKTMWLFKMIR